VDLPRARLSV